MNNKYIFGGFIIVVFLGLMGYLFTQTNIAYENDFKNVMNTENIVKATGAWVKTKNYHIDAEKNLFSFYMVDNHGTELKVVYKGAIPNNFESSTSVVVTGKFQKGVFIANDILTKCPSKYEEEFETDTKS